LRVLFDQGTPVPLRDALSSHEVKTVYELGWSELENGALLRAAEEHGFEAFVTTDHNLKYQQKVSGRRMAILVLPFASWPKLKPHTQLIFERVDRLRAGDFVEWTAPADRIG
jgi:hypothetical protein